MKSLVYGVVCFEWVQTGLITAFAFNVYVYGYGDADNFNNLSIFHNTWFSVPIMCGITEAVVQIFFAWRIHIISRSRLLAGLIVLLALAQLSTSIAGGVEFKFAGSDSARLSTPLIPTGAILSAIVDVLIAVIMTVLLLRSRTGLHRSDDMINRLIRLVIETGSLTASVAIFGVATFVAPSLKDTLLFECPALILAKIYANTLLVNLNNRAFMRRGDAATPPSAEFNNWSNTANQSFGGILSKSNVASSRSNPVHVDVLCETHTDVIPLEVSRGNHTSLCAGVHAGKSEDSKSSFATVV